MTVAEWAVIATAAATAFATPITLALRGLAGAFRELATVLRSIETQLVSDVAELRGLLTERRRRRESDGSTSDDASQGNPPSVPRPDPTPPARPLASPQSAWKRRP